MENNRKKRRHRNGSYGLLLTVGLFCGLIMYSGCGQDPPKITEPKQSAGSEETAQQDEPAVSEEPAVFEETAQQDEPAVSEESAAEDPTNEDLPIQALPQAGKRSFYNLLLTAKEPLGHTMYVWGGGWNEEDTAAGEEARSIGESPRWKEFYDNQNASYDYHNTRYQIHDGLDCSGYVGWVVYNVFETADGAEGYVEKATGMAKSFADRGWGAYTPPGQVTDWKPGDIMSMKGHVWISLGACADGSVVLLHASPPGVMLSGTMLSDGSRSIAVELAEAYMQAHYPNWYAKYPDCARDAGYLTGSGQMRWNADTLTDEERLQEMTGEEILQMLFSD